MPFVKLIVQLDVINFNAHPNKVKYIRSRREIIAESGAKKKNFFTQITNLVDYRNQSIFTTKKCALSGS